MQLSSNIFYQAIQGLDNHPESLRIKKLIFCICRKSWENNTDVLNKLSLENLVKELIQEQSTVEKLTLSLYKLVKTLNRPKVYAGVAKAIIEKLSPVYQDLNKATDIIELQASNSYQETKVSDTEFLLNQVVKNLTHHSETVRIHKLIYAITKHTWENNLTVIQNYGLKNLIIESLEIYPTKQDLTNAFLKLVANINKKDLYLAISKIILGQIGELYDTLPNEENSRPEDPNSYSTQIIAINQASDENRHKSVTASAFETSVIDIISEQVVTELSQTRAVSPSLPPQTTYDLFELRLQIMQYTNPLRAKILLFSLLFHPWDRSGQDWAMLRSYTLDDLLEQLLQSGRPLADIEVKLYNTAKSLSDPDTQLQSASTIIEALKPFL